MSYLSHCKLPLVLSALLGSALSQAQPSSPAAPAPLPQLQNTRVLIVFGPAVDSPAFRAQLQLLERHSFELSRYNTVVVPVSSGPNLSSAHFAFEHATLTGADQEAAARTRYHIAPGEFAVVLVNPDGSEQSRSTTPIDIHSVVSSLDSTESMAPLTASLY